MLLVFLFNTEKTHFHRGKTKRKIFKKAPLTLSLFLRQKDGGQAKWRGKKGRGRKKGKKGK